MTSRDFCYWLQGFFEVQCAGDPPDGKMPGGATVMRGLTHEQAECVRRHLSLVFKHEIDPSMGDAKHQATLDAIHNNPHMVGKQDPNKPVARC